MKYRTESDSMGSKEISLHAYYGVQSLRAYENFKITGLKLKNEFIKSLAEVKKASALVNNELGLINDEIKNAITKACDEIINGQFLTEFIVDPVQGGAGTSMNMNANEVIANRAIELLKGEKGNYTIVHPNDHVNYGQSTNDVIPTAGKMTAIKLMGKTLKNMEELADAFDKKAVEFDHILKMGRTQMQDAVPIRLGQEFGAYSTVVKRDINRLKYAMNELRYVNLGGTAIGTGLNADEEYVHKIVTKLSEISKLKLYQNENLIDGTQNLDSFVNISGALKICASSLSKIANDLRLMSSGPRAGFGEINLPPKQNGSSIMPGKVNPVIPEVINQIAFNIIGNDVTITLAVEAGQLELNAFEPIIFYKLFESIETLSNGIETFTHNCITGITANEEHCKEMVENSVGIITALCPHIGYKKSAEIAKEALKTGKSVRALIVEENLLSEQELDGILDAFRMTKPGIL